MTKAPFFILGSVRAGTTLLRQVLRTHSRLCCPEETHFFRWGYPFGSSMYKKYYTDLPNDLAGKEPVYKLHHKLDRVAEDDFISLLNLSSSRFDLQNMYIDLFMKNNDFIGRRWFDKSPQNIYGILMLNEFYKNPSFIHLVRNPLDVVASLILGEVIRAENIIEACNYWLESVIIFNQFKKHNAKFCFEVKFERFVKSFEPTIDDIFYFLNEDVNLLNFDNSQIRKGWRHFQEVLSHEEINTVLNICGKWMDYYGYKVCLC